MSGCSDEQLRRLDKADELKLASYGQDRSLRPFTTVWVVRLRNGVYLRSAGGPNRPWYKHSMAGGSGRIKSERLDAEAQFESAVLDVSEEIDAADHAKYDRYGPAIVGHVTGPEGASVTVRVLKV